MSDEANFPPVKHSYFYETDGSTYYRRNDVLYGAPTSKEGGVHWDQETRVSEYDEPLTEDEIASISDQLDMVIALDEPQFRIVHGTEETGSNDDGEYRRRTYTVDVGDTSDEDVERMADERWPAEHCMHSYDCCANWYQNSPYIERSGKFAVIILTYTCNI